MRSFGRHLSDKPTSIEQQWIGKYVATLSPESDGSKVDMEATRIALLSERPIDPDKSKDFWNKVRTETEAELFLEDYRSRAEEKLRSLREGSTPTEEETKLRSELEAILAVPFDRQLRKLVNMGTLRPILDEYTPESVRQNFLEKYTHIFLEGLEMEHLVPDPNGPIGLEDLSPDLREEMSQQWTPSTGLSLTGSSDQEPRFAIRMIAYGTDEFGTPRAERARDLFRLWNEHKANRAMFEEAMFKKGYLSLEEKRVPSGKKGKGIKK